METLSLHDAWQTGHHVVTLGRAPWITDPYWQAMNLCGQEIAAADAEALARIPKGGR